MDKYTILIAHPDDELLWMWPALENAKKIVCLSSDANNPERQWCKERRLCLREIGQKLNIEVVCFDHNSEFYRTSTRDSALKRLALEAMKELETPVFTHNQWGEYGHIDHILCNQIAMNSGCDVYSTDIAYDVNWLPIKPYVQYEKRHSMNIDQFRYLKEVYDKRGCWTWSHNPILECGVSRICW
jgi:hypothetical protein